MERPYDISFEVVDDNARLDAGSLVAIAGDVMAGEGIERGTGLAILITDDAEIHAMNRQFLGVDSPTDVLAFPDEDDDFVVGESEGASLGDIAVSWPTAVRQAGAVGHDVNAELRHLLVHGILHLCGYDHVNGGDEEARMRAREEYYLGDLGHAHAHGH